MFTIRVGAVRAGVEPADADHRADFAGRRRRGDGADRAGDHAGKFSAAETRRGHGGVRAGRRGGADSGADARRLDHGQLFLALDFLHQPAGRHFGAVLMAQWLVEDPPYIKRNKHATIDFIGFGLLAVWLATLQIILDKGQEADWFGAEWVRWFTVDFRRGHSSDSSRGNLPRSIRWWICAFSKTGILPWA